MDLHDEDEKKENPLEEQTDEDRKQRQEEGEDDGDSGSGSDEEVVDLPPELAKLLGSQCQTEEQLHVDLVEAGIGNLQREKDTFKRFHSSTFPLRTAELNELILLPVQSAFQ